jgi:hypothetical protein
MQAPCASNRKSYEPNASVREKINNNKGKKNFSRFFFFSENCKRK